MNILVNYIFNKIYFGLGCVFLKYTFVVVP